VAVRADGVEMHHLCVSRAIQIGNKGGGCRLSRMEEILYIWDIQDMHISISQLFQHT